MAELRITARLNRRSAWHLLRQEITALVWAAATLIGSAVCFLAVDRAAGRVAMVLSTIWCVYVARSWGRSALRKVRVAHSGVPTLVLDDLGIRVRNVLGHLDGAWLAWVDCAAVVVSRAPAGPLPVARYVQFVPVHSDRVEGEPQRSDVRPAQLLLSPTESLLAWMELRGQEPGADEVSAWIRRHRPGVRLVDGRVVRQSASDE